MSSSSDSSDEETYALLEELMSRCEVSNQAPWEEDPLGSWPEEPPSVFVEQGGYLTDKGDPCVCNVCDKENYCCNSEECLTVLPEFQHVISETQLKIDMAREMSHDSDYMIGLENENFRHHSYRSLYFWLLTSKTSWQSRAKKAKLESKSLKLPSCFYKVVREKYPDPLGQYSEFSEKKGEKRKRDSNPTTAQISKSLPDLREKHRSQFKAPWAKKN